MRAKTIYGNPLVRLSIVLTFASISNTAFSFSNSTCAFLDSEHLSAQSQQVREENLALVRDCAARAEDKQVSVSYASRSLCKRPDTLHGSLIKYKIKKIDDGFRVRVRFGLMPTGDDLTDERAAEILAQLRQCSVVLHDVWARYNIDLQTSFDLTRDRRERQFDHIADVVDGEGRSDAGTWYVQDSYLCETILHEVGHLLSLNDEYEDVDCPDRPYIAREAFPVSIMNDPRHPLEHLEFFPRHIRSVLEPLCGHETHLGRIKSNEDTGYYFNNTVWTSADGNATVRIQDYTVTDSDGQTWIWNEGFSPSWAGPDWFNPATDVSAHSLLLTHSEYPNVKQVISITSADNGKDRYCFWFSTSNFTGHFCR